MGLGYIPNVVIAYTNEQELQHKLTDMMNKQTYNKVREDVESTFTMDQKKACNEYLLRSKHSEWLKEE